MIFKAIEFATKAHGDIRQYRKGTRIPYMIHPLGVAKILIQYGDPDHMEPAAKKMTAANPHSSPKGIAAPDFLMEISIDRQKHPPYTPTCQNEILINTIIYE